MCNPRRVRVTATRRLTEAWQQEVRRQVRRTGRAVGEARVREPLAATVGAPTLAALAGVLSADPGWERDGDAFRHELGGGYVRYDPDTRDLEIVATLTAEVEATAEAGGTVGGEVDDVVEAEGVGVHYDDGWGGTTRAGAQRAAERDAARALEDAARERVERARREIEQREGGAALAAATAQADAALAEAERARSEQLRAQAAERLTAIGVQGRNLFYEALGAAYRDAILAYARSRGAEGLRCTENGGVVDIEFELEVS